MSKEQLLDKIEEWSSVYEFSFQFWGAGNNNVFIEKASIELYSTGGKDTVKDALQEAYDWIKKQNPNKKHPVPEKPVGVQGTHRYNRGRCNGCGCAIAEGNDYCAECWCEDDSDY